MMEKEEMEEIILDEGKYRFHTDEGFLQCERYGEFWRDFMGDKAVRSLFDECIKMRKLLRGMKDVVELFQQLDEVKDHDRPLESLDCKGIVQESGEMVVGKGESRVNKYKIGRLKKHGQR